VDRGDGSLRPPIEGVPSVEGCRSCAIVQWVASQGTAEGVAYVAETANEGAVVLSGPHFAGFVVIPRRCISGLEELPPLGRAHVLAAVRRAAILIRQRHRVPGSRVVARTDPSAPAGHVSFQVLPSDSEDATGPTSWSPPPPA
jgi:diadenosine tetraphosphate (Ap4A) HIT family hydrolase